MTVDVTRPQTRFREWADDTILQMPIGAALGLG